MALPKLNEVPMYEMTIPSTGKKVRYRPYLVKEEKVMMMAFESGETRAALRSIIDTIEKCLEEGSNINMNELSLFDIEYMFIKLRAKSVGEISNLISPCRGCQHKNPIEVDLDTIEVDVPEGKNIVPITDNVKIELRYPSYVTVIQSDIENIEQNAETALELIARSIVAVIQGDERINSKDEPIESMKEFLESMTASQFQKVSDFFGDTPRLEKEIRYACEKCGQENKAMLRGLDNFF